MCYHSDSCRLPLIGAALALTCLAAGGAFTVQWKFLMVSSMDPTMNTASEAIVRDYTSIRFSEVLPSPNSVSLECSVH